MVGFSGNTKVAQQYCKKHSSAECCLMMPSKRTEYESLQFFPDRVMNPQKTHKPKPLHVFSETYVRLFTIVGIVLAMILCAMGSAYAVFRYRSNEPRPIYLRHMPSSDALKEGYQNRIHMLQ
jgi:hypothetical protein